MKIFMVLAVAAGFALSLGMPDTAAAHHSKGYSKGHKAKSARSYQRRARTGRRARPQVRGYRSSVGGYSYSIPESYLYEPHPEGPRDFIPYMSTTPDPNGIVPSGMY